MALIFDKTGAWLAVFNLAQFVPGGGMQMSMLKAVIGLPPQFSDIVHFQTFRPCLTSKNFPENSVVEMP